MKNEIFIYELIYEITFCTFSNYNTSNKLPAIVLQVYYTVTIFLQNKKIVSVDENFYFEIKFSKPCYQR